MSIEAARRELQIQHQKLLAEASKVAQALKLLQSRPMLLPAAKKRGGWKMSAETIEKIRTAAKRRWAAVKAAKAPLKKKTPAAR